jgi:nucleoside-diphosphate-sugar epimerase
MIDVYQCWRGRRVLVTGCTGFLGSALTRELLAAGVDVLGLVRERATVPAALNARFPGRFHTVRGRTEDTFRISSALAIHDIAAVFHLASSDANPDRGTASILDAAGLYDPRVPVVMARPNSVNGLRPPASMPLRVNLGNARFGEVFGGGDRKALHVVPATITALLAGERPGPIGTSAATNFVHVADATRALVMAANALAEREGTLPLDVTFRSGWNLTERAMATAVRDVFETGVTNVALQPPPLNPLGWSPTCSLSEALSETINWHRDGHRNLFTGTTPHLHRPRAAA